MTQYITEFSNRYEARRATSGVDQALADLAEYLTKIPPHQGTWTGVIARVDLAQRELVDALTSQDSALIPMSLLGSITGAIATIISDLDQCAAGNDRSEKVDSVVDQLVEHIATFRMLKSPNERATAATNKIRSVARTVESELTTCLNTTTSALEDISHKLGNQQATLSEVEQRVEEVNRAAVQTINDIEKQAQAALETSKVHLQESATKKLAELEQLATDRSDQQAAALKERLAQTEDLYQKLQTVEAQVLKTAESVGNGAHSAGWGTYAEQQRKVANSLLVASVVILCAAAGFAVWLAVSAAQADYSFGWVRVVTKLSVSGAFAGIGAYLAAQSSEHRGQERAARRRHLDLLALPPFIAHLPDEERTAIIKKHALEGFLSVTADSPRSASAGTSKTLVDTPSIADDLLRHLTTLATPKP